MRNYEKTAKYSNLYTTARSGEQNKGVFKHIILMVNGRVRTCMTYFRVFLIFISIIWYRAQKSHVINCMC